ncbi:hypothetical protein TNCV_4494341 [Trichonephila clavipes]|nr:hypothetical protein TNCV_4494341 [Trichonephila clavipes]
MSRSSTACRFPNNILGAGETIIRVVRSVSGWVYTRNGGVMHADYQAAIYIRKVDPTESSEVVKIRDANLDINRVECLGEYRNQIYTSIEWEETLEDGRVLTWEV